MSQTVYYSLNTKLTYHCNQCTCLTRKITLQRHVQALKCLILVLWVEFVSASEKGQPLYKGQRAHSQFVHYSEVLLYTIDLYEYIKGRSF